MTATSVDDAVERPRRAIAPIIGTVIGGGFLAFGIWSAFVGDRVRPPAFARWIIGADLLHDLVVAPVVVAVAWGVGRIVPPVARAPIRFGLAASAVLSIYAWPFVRGYGHNPRVPSLLNRHYGVGLAVYIAVAWMIAGIWLVAAVARRRRVQSDRIAR